MSQITKSSAGIDRSKGRVIFGLIVPFTSIIFQLSAFVVALPAIRSEFALAADTTSWLILVYTIPFILFMPFYGRLGDRFGAKVLMIIGLALFGAGTLISLFSTSMGLVILGRIVQASGAASINPLCLSILTRAFPSESRGRAIGTWNSAGPLFGMIGPVVGGILVDAFGWRSVFVPVAALTLLAVPVLIWIVPSIPVVKESSQRRRLDWTGMFLTAVMLTGFVLYLSSRPVTGYAPFTDWRLLVATTIVGTLWYLWERHTPEPFVAISLFRNRQFACATGSVGTRMLLLGTVSFLVPLYVADVIKAEASDAGIVMAFHALALLITLRLGGAISDRFSQKLPIVVGMFGQGLILLVVAGWPGYNLARFAIQMAMHGGLAGLSLAPLHRIAMQEVPPAETGAGAATYSMGRFFGHLVGASIMGVVLEQFLSSQPNVTNAYRFSFLVAALVGIAGTMPTLFIRDRQRT